MKSRRWIKFGVLATGIACGVLLTAVSRRRPPAAPQADDPGAQLEVGDTSPSALELQRLRLKSLEAKVAALEGGQAPAPGQAGRRGPPPHPTPEQRAALIEEDFRRHEELIAQNMSAPRVEAWANQMEKKLDDRLAKLPPDLHGKYLGSDCRT